MEIIHTRISYWEGNNFPYDKVLDLSESDLSNLLAILTRQDIIEWLIWNDHNGVYGDEDSIREFGNVLEKDQGMEIMISQVEENRIPVSKLKILN